MVEIISVRTATLGRVEVDLQVKRKYMCVCV